MLSKQRFLLSDLDDLDSVRTPALESKDLKSRGRVDQENTPCGPAMEQPGPCPPKVQIRGCRDSKASSRAMKVLYSRIVSGVSCYSSETKTNHRLQQAIPVLKSYLYLFHIYGFDFSIASPSDLYEQVLKLILDLAEVLQTNVWVDYFKYKNSAFFAAWNPGQVLPPEPSWLGRCKNKNPKYLFGGCFYRWLHREMADPVFAKSFSLSILQSKKGMPRPDKELVRAAEVKAEQVMTSVKPQTNFETQVVDVWQTHCNYVLNEGARIVGEGSRPSEYVISFGREFMEKQVERTTKKIFSDFDLSLETLSGFLLPSSSANYNWSRSKFGTWSELCQVNTKTGECALRELRQHMPRLRYKMTKLRDRVSELYGLDGEFETAYYRMQDATCEVIGCEVEYEDFLKSWRIFYWRCVNHAYKYESDAFCQVVGLAEALKVRTISKGPPLTYFVLKPLQKALWKQLQKYWNFELTGTPITEDLMNRRFRRFIGGGYRFHSGDYSAATDELHSWVSERIANTIMDCWDKNSGFNHDIFRWLFLNALTGHTYVTQEGNLPQRRGQLMGSIVSFPVLCVANIALLETAYNLSHDRSRFKSIRSLPIWVNGDDCLSAYWSKTFPILWKGLGSVMGFQESVGKTYDSDEFCSINSTFFDIHADRWVHRDYVNLGLMFGLVRSAVGENVATEKRASQLGSVHKELIRTSPEALRPLVHDLFIHLHRKTLDTYPGPWFLPEYLGGLGLVDVHGTETSLFDRKIVTCLREMYNSGVEMPSFGLDGDWVLYDFFHKKVREHCPLIDSYSYESYENSDSYGSAFKAIVLYEFVYRGFENLTLTKDLQEAKIYTRRVGVFNKAARSVKKNFEHYKPCSLETLQYEKKIRAIPIWGQACNTVG